MQANSQSSWPFSIRSGGFFSLITGGFSGGRIIRRAHSSPLTLHSAQVLCELLASAGKIPESLDSRAPLVRLLSKITPDLLGWLFGKRFRPGPFVDIIDAKRIFPGTGRHTQVLRRRWRLLKRRMVQGPGSVCSFAVHDVETAFGIDTTLSDLGFIRGAGRQPGRVESRWRAHGKAVVSRAASRQKPVQPLSRLYWGGSRGRKIRFWEKLVATQAGELTQIRRLAEEVSSRTGRVVLSWHNASLGAAGGWAFEDSAARFASPAQYGLFVRAVREEAAQIGKSFNFSAAMELFDLRTDRIFARKIELAEEHSRICALFASPSQESTTTGGKFEWPGTLSPHQLLPAERVRAWIEKARQDWPQGLILLFALTNLGQRMLDAGEISSCALPWIDKFFISSRRRADIFYLERLFQFVSANIKRPLVLFWDDTARREAPSLGLALRDLAGRGLPVRGIGIFGCGPPAAAAYYREERENAVQAILSGYPGKTLFALRPLNENHCPDAFRRIFKDLDMSFFVNYDSSWKDNLAFIYTGTQVFPLLSGQTEMECESPWVCAGRERFAFGAWFRRMLRRISLGRLDGTPCPLCIEYGAWANLL